MIEPPWSIDRVLGAWAACVVGGVPSMTVHSHNAGEPDVLNDEIMAYSRVVRIKGYNSALPVLLHVHVHTVQKPGARPVPNGYRFRLPGEPLDRALLRLNWNGVADRAEDMIPVAIYDRFVERLRLSLEQFPFVGVLPELDSTVR